MPTRISRRLSPVVAGALLLCVPLAARTQPRRGSGRPAAGPGSAAAPTASAPPAASSASAADTTKEEARTHFSRGLELFAEEAWSPALAEFLLSRRLFPTRSATQNAALSLRKLQRFDEALDMFDAEVRDFALSPADRTFVTQQIRDLSALVGALSLTASEAGASVVIDQRDRGATPLPGSLRVSAGSHVVRVYKEGFTPFELRVDVAGGETKMVDARLGALTQSGRLKVSEPSGKSVSVVVDNVVVGKTPWEGPLSLGSHAVALRGEGNLGSQPASAVITLNQTTSLTLGVEPLEANLRVEPTPIVARVAIDGVSVGTGVWEGALAAGSHRVEVAADGFLPVERQFTLAKDQRETVAVGLERDPNSALFRAENPPRFILDVHGGPVFAPSLSGDLVSGCGGSCSKGLGLGALVMAHGGYQLSSGLGFLIEGGYLTVGQKLSGRSALLTPVGLPANTGMTNDSLSLKGPLVGLAAALHRGSTLPFTARIGAGVLLGTATDERSGAFTPPPDSKPPTSYAIAPIRQSANATYLYIDPEVRLGYRLGAHFEVGLGLRALILIGLKQPSWDDQTHVLAGTCCGLATFGVQTITGKNIVLVSPDLGVRADF